jgi:pyruvate dehydrogenase E2 component (dihydrolipoamide acetyltransferase)
VDDHAAFDEALAEIGLDVAPAGAAAVAADAAAPPPAASSAPAAAADLAATVPAAAQPSADGHVPASPAARRAAREAGLALAGIAGSGPGGRVVLRDLPAAGTASAGTQGADAVFTGRFGALQLRRWNAGAAPGRPTLVLIHGLFGDIEGWSVLARALAEAGQPVVALDLPLHGRSQAGASTLADMAQAVRELLDATVSGPRVLVGHSLGGALALMLAQGMDARSLRALALIAPAGLGTEIDQGFVDGMLHAGRPALLRREVDKLTRRPQPLGEAWLAELHARLQQRSDGLQALVGGFAVHGVQQVDLRTALAGVATRELPVAVLWGRLDRVIPWQHALDLPPQVALHLFPEAGHLPHAEQAAPVAQVLLRLAGAPGH